ncbi:MFS transporter [Sporolactobacillus pectinivorans]|uniref:MFS transporter n=1 Tax=Sporolactobacillus pectinivorans TaxID=1591408 RepID=UPI000C2624C7|nr:MFS transporter [Sporolactobacillus pectinivorans]
MTRLRNSHTVFLAAICTGTILNPLNSSMIALALHSIQNDYRLSFATVSWLVSGFYLASAVGQPLTGKMGDLVGRKRIFMIGLVIAAIAAIGAPLAPAFLFLLLMRILQAAGSSAVYPSGVALVQGHVIHDKQASSLAVLAICASVMTAFGPTVGGFLIVWGGWPGIFYVNLPFIFVSFTLGWLVIPKDVKKTGVNFRSVIHDLDLPGIFLFSTGMICLLWFLLTLEEAVHVFVAGIGLLSFVFFAWREWRTEKPFVDLRLLKKNHTLSLVYLLFVLMNLANYCLFYGMPTYFQSALHFNVRLSGMMMLFMSMASVAVSLLTGRWVDRIGPGAPIKTSATATVAGAILLLLVTLNQSAAMIGIALIVLGAGYGVGNVALQSAMLDVSPKESVGISSGLFQTCRYIGSILSSAVLGLIFGKTVTAAHLLTLSWVLIAVSIPALLLSLVFFRNGRRLSAH